MRGYIAMRVYRGILLGAYRVWGNHVESNQRNMGHVMEIAVLWV